MIVPVTRPEYEKGKTVFSAVETLEFVPVAPEEDTLAAFVRQHRCRAAVIGVSKYRGPLYQALSQRGLLVRFGVATDNIDREKARDRAILIANTPGALDQAVAEHTLFLMGALVRHLTRSDQEVKAGKWNPLVGEQLSSLRLGLVGLGNIGFQVACLAHQGFGMETLIFSRHSPEETASRRGLSVENLRLRLGWSLWSDRVEEILPGSDIVSVHLPLTEKTAGFFHAARFARFKTGSFFINTARGGLVVEKDLAQAILSGKLAGAALDVFQKEPYQPTDGVDLRQLPGVIMTPHIASNTRTANLRMARMVVENILHWERGELDLVHLVR